MTSLSPTSCHLNRNDQQQKEAKHETLAGQGAWPENLRASGRAQVRCLYQD